MTARKTYMNNVLSNCLSIYDVIVVQKNSNGDGKFPFYGWGNYFHRTLSLNLHSTIPKGDEKT